MIDKIVIAFLLIFLNTTLSGQQHEYSNGVWVTYSDSIIIVEFDEEKPNKQETCAHNFWLVVWHEGDKCPYCGWVYHEPICDHAYVYLATPGTGKDSIMVINLMEINSPEYSSSQAHTPVYRVQISANEPCICLFCHNKTLCY